MRTQQRNMGTFQRVGECLYRYSSNGVYYARIKTCGKEIRRSLATADRDLAKRNLAKLKDEQRQIDRSKSKTTLADLCNQYLRTVQHQKPKTVERKTYIVNRIKKHWPSGSGCQVGKIKPSDVQLWLARYKFGPVSRNLHLACIKEILSMAVGDGIIPSSPAANLKAIKLDKPIRKTPTFQEFGAIVENIRSQQFNPDAEESADFVEFIGHAGLGQAEASALRWSDIDWQREQIITFRHKTKSGFAIPLYPQLRPVLEQRHSRRTPTDDRVFRIKDAKKAISAACKRLKLPAYSHRSFRRMFITRAIELGVDVKVIAEWQGHKDGGKLILGTYSHVNPVHSQRMAKLMTDQPCERGRNEQGDGMSLIDDLAAEIDAKLDRAEQKSHYGRKYSPAFEIARQIQVIRKVLSEKAQTDSDSELNSVERKFLKQTAGLLLMSAITSGKKLRQVADALDAQKTEDDPRQANIIEAYADCIAKSYPPTLAELREAYVKRFREQGWPVEPSIRKTLRVLGLPLRASKRGRPIGSRNKI